MGKKVRFLSMALAIVMILPMLVVFPITVNATGSSTYDLMADGQWIRTVNFKADYWKPDYHRKSDGTSDNKGADIAVSNDGTTIKLTVQNANNKRAMWGGFYPDDEDEDEYEASLGDILPMKAGVKYTMVFDLKLGSDNVAFGIQVDGNAALAILGNGQTRWYNWNKFAEADGGVSDGTEGEKWTAHTDYTRGDTITYAVTVDYDAKTMELWVKDTNGAFYLCRSITNTHSSVWDSSYFRCRLTVRSWYGTPNSSYYAEVSNLNIYKGKILKQISGDAYLPYYASHVDGNELLDVDFGSVLYMTPSLSSDNSDNDLDVAVDGGSVTFTSKDADNKRGIWGGSLPADFFPLSSGVKYTVYFSLTMDAGMTCAFYPDGTKGIAIIQDKTYTRYQSRSTQSGTSANWANKTDYGSGLRKFAVEIDYDTGTLTLWGRNRNGRYSYINQRTGLTFDQSVLGVYFWVGNTAGNSVTVSDMWIEKGLNIEELDRDEIGFTDYKYTGNKKKPKYDGTLLQTVNFNATGWNPVFADYNNLGADVTINSDTSVSFLLHNGDNYRAMWGAPLVDPLPLLGTINGNAGVKYTFIYDVTFGNTNMRVGLMPDGNNSLMIRGNGNVQWFKWNTPQGDVISEKWTDHTDVTGLSQTFAVTMDYDATTYALYVKRSDGSFEEVLSVTKSDIWNTRATINCQFRVDRSSGTPDETYNVTVSNLKIYKGTNFAAWQSSNLSVRIVEGAAVRLSNPTGLRFSACIEKAYVDGLKSTYGADNVTMGMLIVPTSYLTDNSLSFTKAALDGCEAITGVKCLEMDVEGYIEAGEDYTFNCVIANVKSSHYTMAFSAITYVKVNGSIYAYSSYNATYNSRSISSVATAALNDYSSSQHDEYQNAWIVGTKTRYSPYTEEQRTILSGFCS